MAMYMTLTDGTETVNLAGTEGWCLSFGLETPSVSAETATDSHEIELIGGSATVAASLAKINRLFAQAVKWQRSKEGPRVFVTYHLDGGNHHRSEVVDGSMQLTPDMVNYERALGTRKGRLTVVRGNWLEQAEVTATIASANADNRTYVQGSYAGTSPTKRVNYWDVNALSLAGDLPAPVRLSLWLYGFNSSTPTAQPSIYVTMARSAAQLETLAMETTWFEDGGALWTDNADANFTNSDYQTRVVAADPEYEEFAPTAGTYINRFGSDVGFYRMYARVGVDTPGTYKLIPTFEDGAGFYRYGKSFYHTFDSDNDFIDCGGMYLPAAFSTAKTMLATCSFGLTAVGMAGVQLTVDWAHFLRADGWRKYIGLNTATQIIEDDQIDGSAVYSVNVAGSTRQSDLQAEGEAGSLSLMPGKWHRYYIHGDYETAFPVSASVIPVMVYRPRFLSLA